MWGWQCNYCQWCCSQGLDKVPNKTKCSLLSVYMVHVFLKFSKGINAVPPTKKRFFFFFGRQTLNWRFRLRHYRRVVIRADLWQGIPWFRGTQDETWWGQMNPCGRASRIWILTKHDSSTQESHWWLKMPISFQNFFRRVWK